MDSAQQLQISREGAAQTRKLNDGTEMKDFRIEDGKSVRKVEWERKIDRGKGEKGVNEKERERIHREPKREGEERERDV